MRIKEPLDLCIREAAWAGEWRIPTSSNAKPVVTCSLKHRYLEDEWDQDEPTCDPLRIASSGNQLLSVSTMCCVQ